MQQLPLQATRAASNFVAAGWRTANPIGRVTPPLGDQPIAAQWIEDPTWQAMALLELQERGAAGEVCAGARRQDIAPTLAPGSGWYRPGQWTPSSLVARQEMRSSAIPATVVVLRRRGDRVPAAELLRAEPPSGWLLCMDQYTAPAWYACLFADESMAKETLPRLLHARLERQNDGVRLYGGIEPAAATERGQPDFRQAWLCAPTPERAREILLEMLQREGGSL